MSDTLHIKIFAKDTVISNEFNRVAQHTAVAEAFVVVNSVPIKLQKTVQGFKLVVPTIKFEVEIGE